MKITVFWAVSQHFREHRASIFQITRGHTVSVHTPGTHPPQYKVVHDSLRVLSKLEKYMKPRVIHFTRQITAPSSEIILHSCKWLTFQVPLGGTEEHKELA
jgi:hypothetical protein